MPPESASVVEVLQQLIRNRCVSEGSPSMGYEVLNAEVLHRVEGHGTQAGRHEQRREPGSGRGPPDNPARSTIRRGPGPTALPDSRRGIDGVGWAD